MDKSYYTLNEVSEMLDVHPWTIQMWVNRFGEILKPWRDSEGRLLFTALDVGRIEKIRGMVKTKGITIHDVVKKIYLSESEELRE